jgi:uncharacterized protein YigA (DUF484 family)
VTPPTDAPQGVQGITEQDIANYLANTPGFFERHAELLSTVQLTSPHGQRAVSLQERQMEMLRERIKGLELRIVEMIRNSQENVAIADRLQRWTRSILLTNDARELPEVAVQELQRQFLIPQAALRLWSLAPAYADDGVAQIVSDDAKAFASSLVQPYCGLNAGFEAVGWLESPTTVASMALIPLRHGLREEPFGLLVLASPDPTRFAADMGTEFLARIGETASAGLSRLL